MHPEWSRDGLLVTTDPARIDLPAVHAFLTESYWARGIPRAHSVYRKVGFQGLAHPDRHLEIARPDLYRTSAD